MENKELQYLMLHPAATHIYKQFYRKTNPKSLIKGRLGTTTRFVQTTLMYKIYATLVKFGNKSHVIGNNGEV